MRARTCVRALTCASVRAGMRRALGARDCARAGVRASPPPPRTSCPCVWCTARADNLDGRDACLEL
eukprot:8088879-Pyramimonas_sp.AAC.1